MGEIMKKIWKHSYFNRRNWLLENIKELGLNERELLVLLLIDLFNETSRVVNLASLSEISGVSEVYIDEAMTSLCSRGYVSVSTKKGVMLFNIDGVFSQPQKVVDVLPVFKTFENEFARPLTQYELVTLNEWLREYDDKMIILALRQAAIYRNLSVKYIDSILSNWKKKNVTVEMIEEGNA